jgi:hypothetical protein
MEITERTKIKMSTTNAKQGGWPDGTIFWLIRYEKILFK